MRWFRRAPDEHPSPGATMVALPPAQAMHADMLPKIMHVEQNAYAHPWRQGHFVDALHSGYHMPVWFDHEEVMAYLVAMRGADEVHLLNFTVSPVFQKQGLAPAMLNHLQTWSVQQGVHSIWLEVRASNARALSVYAAHGFVQDGIRPGYYPLHHGQREDAVVMSLNWST